MDGLNALVFAALLACAPASVVTGVATGEATGQATGKEAEVWKSTWSDLARLSAAPPGSPERERLWRALESFRADRELAGHKASDRTEALRARILRFHLLRSNGGAPAKIVESGASIEFLPGEAWLALQALGPGPTRARAAIGSLAEARDDELRARAELARGVVEEDARELHLDWALEEARALRERSPEPWTAALLSRTLRLRGEYDAALKVLDPAIELATERPARGRLMAERARVHAAAGADDLALSDLGSALASGASEAGLALGLRALAEGETARARASFRSSTGPEALRGYGLALLARTGPIFAPADPDPGRNPPNRPN